MNNTITEMKNIPEEINSKIAEAKEQISELEDRMLEITTEEQDTQKRMKRNEDSLKDLWDNIICITLQIIEVPEKEKREDLKKYLKKLQSKM